MLRQEMQTRLLKMFLLITRNTKVSEIIWLVLQKINIKLKIYSNNLISIVWLLATHFGLITSIRYRLTDGFRSSRTTVNFNNLLPTAHLLSLYRIQLITEVLVIVCVFDE